MMSLPIQRERFYPALLMLLTAAAVLGRLLLDGGSAGAYVLWGLGVLMGFFAVREAVPHPGRCDSVAPWGILGLGIVAAFLSPGIPAAWALWLGCCALFAYTGGIYMLLRLALPAFLLIIMVPSTGFLYLLLSFPLSRFCAMLTVGVLRLFGVGCGFDQAIIYVGEERIAVTAACSGIELLEAMLLIGWLIVHFEHRRLVPRLVHFLALLPIIVLTNSLRLVLVILLSLWIGDRAFDDPLHSIFGYGVVISSVLLMYGIGRFFQKWENGADSPAETTGGHDDRAGLA